MFGDHIAISTPWSRTVLGRAGLSDHWAQILAGAKTPACRRQIESVQSRFPDRIPKYFWHSWTAETFMRSSLGAPCHWSCFTEFKLINSCFSPHLIAASFPDVTCILY